VTAVPIDDREFRLAVGAAIRAPSLHNSQPWRFRLAADEIEVLGDPARTPPVADPTAWALRLACGAATYNLQLAFAAGGQPLSLQWRPDPHQRSLMATLRPEAPRPPTPRQERLFRAIPERHSNRRPFRAEPVPPAARVAMIEAATAEGAWLELVVGRIPVAAVSEIAHAANRVLLRNAAYAAELASWSGRDVGAVDGVPAGAGGFTAEPRELLPQRSFGDLVRTAGEDFQDEPLIAVLGTSGNSPIDQLRAGYALQRVLLTITDQGLASSMLSQPIEVAAAQEQLRIALGRHGTPQMVLRIGYGDPASATSRRPVSEVIDERVAGPNDLSVRALRP
jgi:nitroreductase